MATPLVLQGNMALSVDRSPIAICEGRGTAAIRNLNGISGRNVHSLSGARCSTPDRGGRGFVRGHGLNVGFGANRRFRIAGTNRGSGGRRSCYGPQAVFEARAEPKKTWIPLELIASEAQFDQVLSEARERNEPVIIDWMAAWCRKCLYLKPKLEKLAANYQPGVKFYYVDVNNVPQALVQRAEVTQMPTIQLWRDGESEAQVIGGQEAALVVDKVREMISNSKTEE